MARPSKPYAVLTSEKKSHRTKKELMQRRDGEEKLLSGVKIKEAPEVRDNEHAHKEYRRVRKLLTAIGKEDELYGATINRYCMLTAEIIEHEEERAYYLAMLKEMKEDLHAAKEKLDNPVDYLNLFTAAAAAMTKITASINTLDKTIQQKRKMLFDIEKESVMTISAALRTVPKKEEKATNPLLEALGSG